MKLNYSFATQEELELIHVHSLKLLVETGVVFYADEALEIFKKHGARVEDKTVYIEEGKPTIKSRTEVAYKKRIEEYVMPEMDKAQKTVIEKYIPKDFWY